MEELKCKARLRIFRHDTSFGPGIAQLMENVDKTGSLAESCRMMNMSYSKGWKIIKRCEEDMKLKLFISNKGGKDHGATEITDEGRQLLKAYRAIESDLEKCLAESFERNLKNQFS